MTTFDGDQPTTAFTTLPGGGHASAGAAQIKAASPTGSAYTFTAAYSHTVRGQHLSYRRGQTVSLSLDVRTALLAAGAPMVAA